MREADLEKKVTALFSQYSIPIKIYKTGFPDKVFLFPKGNIIFIEFKSHGKKLQVHQKYIGDVLKKFGYKFYKCDNFKHALEILKENVDI